MLPIGTAIKTWSATRGNDESARQQPMPGRPEPPHLPGHPLRSLGPRHDGSRPRRSACAQARSRAYCLDVATRIRRRPCRMLHGLLRHRPFAGMASVPMKNPISASNLSLPAKSPNRSPKPRRVLRSIEHGVSVLNGRYANSLRAWGYLVAALFGVVAVERGVQAPSSEVTVTPPAREEVSGVTVALRVAPRAAPTPAPTVSQSDEVLRVAVRA